MGDLTITRDGSRAASLASSGADGAATSSGADACVKAAAGSVTSRLLSRLRRIRTRCSPRCLRPRSAHISGLYYFFGSTAGFVKLTFNIGPHGAHPF